MSDTDGNGTENQFPKWQCKTLQTKLTTLALFMPACMEQNESKSDVSTHNKENTLILKHDTSYPFFVHLFILKLPLCFLAYLLHVSYNTTIQNQLQFKSDYLEYTKQRG